MLKEVTLKEVNRKAVLQKIKSLNNQDAQAQFSSCPNANAFGYFFICRISTFSMVIYAEITAITQYLRQPCKFS